MRPRTVQTNTQWKMCGNTPRYSHVVQESVATNLVSQHGENTCGRMPRVVPSTCSIAIQKSSLSSFCWANLAGRKCGEGCLDKIVTAQIGVLGINVGQIREASVVVPMSQEILSLSADNHLCHCWKASTCSETDVRASLATSQSTAWIAKREHRQLQALLHSAAYAADALWAVLDDENVSQEKFHASAVLPGNSARSNSSEPTRRNAESLVFKWLRTCMTTTQSEDNLQLSFKTSLLGWRRKEEHDP